MAGLSSPCCPRLRCFRFDDVEALDVIDESTACVITEPIQGEGGIRVPSKQWLKVLRERCDAAGALLVFDEIQTGFGRTGALFAFQRFGVIPDILTLAKAMGGGMPLGAFVSRGEVFDVFRRDPPLSHVTTFGGHPVSCAAGLSAIDVLTEEKLAARSLVVEARIRTALSFPDIVELRGMGCMLGLELGNSEFSERVVRRCMDDGVLLGWTLHSDSLIRLAPPLNIPFDTLDAALHIIVEALEAG